MPFVSVPRRLAGLALAALAAAGCAGAGAEVPAAAPAAGPPVVRRGDLTRRVLLTGELRAARARDLVVPRAPTWRVQIRWLEEDGAEVAAGQKVVEFDSSEFTSDLEEKRLALGEKENELARSRARGEIDEAEKAFALEGKRTALEKAESRADVPEELLSARELQDRRLELERARIELDKAAEALEAARAAHAAERDIQRIAVDGARREIAVAERALAELTLTAPESGIFVVESSPWESARKLQEGDMVFIGMTVGRLPELASMQVEAVLWDVDEGRVGPGMQATCTLDAYPDRAYPCHLVRVAPVAREDEWSRQLRYFAVDVALDEHDPARMRPGMSVKVEVTTDHLADALLVPRVALDREARPPRARRADGGWSEVALGPCDTQECVVVSGLGEGERLAPAVPAAAPGEAGR